ncbi:MAG: type II toxin-antitoxin system CcdA family antitoxin [Bacteroidota bacterium]
MTRKNTNLTISEGVIKKAKKLEGNPSQADEEGISKAVKKKHEEIWLEENKLAIQTYNDPLIKPLWVK